MKVMVGVLAYGGVFPQTFECFTRDTVSDEDIQWLLSVERADAAVDRARGLVATKFLQTDADVLMMIDHDMEWHPGDLASLARDARRVNGVVGGVVSKKAIGQGIGGRFPDSKPIPVGRDELIGLPEDCYVGGAMLAISRPVIEKLSELCPKVVTGFHPIFLPMIKWNEALKGNDYLSEDWAFCHRAREAGFPVFASQKPQIIHHGSFSYTVKTAFAGRTATL